jgi:predicted DNA-binding transcriptional regulator YafY
MERNTEIIRQWKILRRISTTADCTVSALLAEHRVCRRTIYRDLDALQMAGFPLYDERVDGKVYWRMDAAPFRRLTDTAFTFAELCAFYVTGAKRAAGASPVQEDYGNALTKLTAALSPKMRQYLDKLTTVMTWKAEPGKRREASKQAEYQEHIVRAILEHRKVEMVYHSFSSRKVKQYGVEPYRLAYGNGGLYLFAYVPIYGQMRSFAVQRIRDLRVLDEQFSPVQEPSEDPFAHSLGVFTGDPHEVRIAFSPAVALYVEEGQWHPSQTIEKQADGSIILTMKVCVDVPLRTWILGFGPQARVVKPSSLAEAILEELEEAREQYAPRMPFELPPPIYDERQFPLPFQASRKSKHLGASRRPRRSAVRQPRA